MTYRAPVADIAFTLKHGAGMGRTLAQGGELGAEDVNAVLEEAGRFATDVLAPLNAPGDKFGTPFKDGAITMPPGWKEAYRSWAAAGWNAVSLPDQWGGQALPHALNAACIEMWNSASMAFGIGPVLTMGAAEALANYGTKELKQTYLRKLVSGEWMGTMQLTEPQAGSDVGALRTKAVRHGDGSYRITGQKIFITYGEHDLTDNIIHFVLARLTDAPPGNKGISLFLVPKFLLNADGTPGAVVLDAAVSFTGTAAAPVAAGEARLRSAAVTLPGGFKAGRVPLRATARVGTETLTSRTRTLALRKPGGWSTSARQDGAWSGKAQNLPVRFRVSGRGRTVKAGRFQILLLCPTPGMVNQFTTQLADAPLTSARVAPDGSFVFAGAVRDHVTFIKGRIRGKRATGRANLSLGHCTGAADFSAKPG